MLTGLSNNVRMPQSLATDVSSENFYIKYFESLQHNL